MPHYADGTQAKVGDFVTGPLYNSKGTKAGTIVSITPGHDVCNAKVRFVEVCDRDAPRPRMAVVNGDAIATEEHGTSGPIMIRYECEDYCEVKALTLISQSSELPSPTVCAPVTPKPS